MHSTKESFMNKHIILISTDIIFTENVLFYQRTRVDKGVFWPQYFRKIEYVCLIGFWLT